jgi:hypothetical protein
VIWADAERTASALAEEANRLWQERWGELRETDGFQVHPIGLLNGQPVYGQPPADFPLEGAFYYAEVFGGESSNAMDEPRLRELLRRYLATRGQRPK